MRLTPEREEELRNGYCYNEDVQNILVMLLGEIDALREQVQKMGPIYNSSLASLSYIKEIKRLDQEIIDLICENLICENNSSKP